MGISCICIYDTYTYTHINIGHIHMCHIYMYMIYTYIHDTYICIYMRYGHIIYIWAYHTYIYTRYCPWGLISLVGVFEQILLESNKIKKQVSIK